MTQAINPTKRKHKISFTQKEFFSEIAKKKYLADPFTVESTYLVTKDIIDWGFYTPVNSDVAIMEMLKEGCKAYDRARQAIKRYDDKILHNKTVIEKLLLIIDGMDSCTITTRIAKLSEGIIAETEIGGRIYSFYGKTKQQAIDGLKRKYAIETHGGDWISSQYFDELNEILTKKQKLL